MTYKWFADLSHWNNLSRAQAVELVQNGCIGFAIKAGQGVGPAEDNLCAHHVALAQELSVPFVLYHWPDPIKDPIKQARFAIDLALKYKPNSIIPDIEQYWMDWTEWYNVTVLHLPGTIRAYGADYLLRFYSAYLKELNRVNRAETKLPIMTYSAQWFFHGYCRALAPVVRDTTNDYWNAAYVAWRQLDQDPHLSWNEFHATLDNLVLNEKKCLPNGITKWGAWQFGVANLPGWASLDCDVITDEAAARYFGTDPIIIPEPTPIPPVPAPIPPTPSTLQMEVIADVLNIRDGPSASSGDIGDLHKGDILSVIDVAGTAAWIEFEEGKYACVQGVKDRYMKRHTGEG